MKNVKVLTMGCSKNLVDSEFLLKQLQVNGFHVNLSETTNPNDVVIINTCGFIGDAKKESIDTILQYAAARKSGQLSGLYVMGCLSQRYKKELSAEIHEVDDFFGVNDLNKILTSLGASYKEPFAYSRLTTTPTHFAYLKISEGCNRHCSFCAIPGIRGENTSKSIETLVKETSLLAQSGVKELLIIAQDITSYGVDIYNKCALPQLVSELEKIDDIEWIRLHYAYPSSFPMELIEMMKTSKKICKYLDIPVQHISDNILKRMRRGHNSLVTRKLITGFRSLIPEIALRTTLIVGFPGETEEDFNELKDFVREFKFDRMGVFAYSEEEDTYAAEHYKDDIPQHIKNQRVDELMEIQQEISLSLNASKVGKAFKVLIDREEEEYYVGRTEFDSPEVDNEVLISKKDNKLHVGDFYSITIISADYFDLYGQVL